MVSPTKLADAYIKETKSGLSDRFVKKYLKGRGRYGATSLAKTAKLEMIFQERETGFKSRESDPLEWVRNRLRERRKEYVKSAEELYEAKRTTRPIKPVYI